MPKSPKRICPRHRIIVESGAQCPQCQRQKRTPDTRQNSSARGYNRRWEEASRRYRDDHPLCVECEKLGIVKASEEVDHIIPHGGDQELFWDESNWQALCGVHHRQKTARERQQKR